MTLAAPPSTLSGASIATAPATDTFEPDAVFASIAARLPALPAVDALDRTVVPPFGDHTLNEWAISPAVLEAARPAAVLVGLVVREQTLSVLLTERTADLRSHAGQIAFPGGKMDPGDASPAAAALREAWEEVGLAAERVTVLGHLGGYLTRTGYRILPVVARIDAPFSLTLNPAEVVASFEVPFATLMNTVSYGVRQRDWMGTKRSFYAIEHGERTIWGVTAGILHVLFESLYG